MMSEIQSMSESLILQNKDAKLKLKPDRGFFSTYICGIITFSPNQLCFKS